MKKNYNLGAMIYLSVIPILGLLTSDAADVTISTLNHCYIFLSSLRAK